MNFLAHARDLLDRPWVTVGNAVPDWLSFLDRRCRLRPWHLAELRPEGETPFAEFTAGLLRHFEDDAWFHSSEAFREIRRTLGEWIREGYPHGGKRGLFFGHLLLEMLLDAHLLESDPTMIEGYYRALDAVDPAVVEEYASRLTPRPPEGLADLMERFRKTRIFDAYEDDAALVHRLELAGMRAGLPPLPRDAAAIVARARPLVRERAGDLLPPRRP